MLVPRRERECIKLPAFLLFHVRMEKVFTVRIKTAETLQLQKLLRAKALRGEGKSPTEEYRMLMQAAWKRKVTHELSVKFNQLNQRAW